MLKKDGTVCGRPAATMIECKKKTDHGERGSAVFVCDSDHCVSSGATLLSGLERQGYKTEYIPIHYVLVIEPQAAAPNPTIQNAN